MKTARLWTKVVAGAALLPMLTVASVACTPGIGPDPARAAKPAPTASVASGQVSIPWMPKPGVAWQIQFSGALDLSVGAQVYDVDGFDASKATVDAVHNRGAKAICYVSAGSWENWRPDAAKFPAAVKGASNGWPGERWLDVRRLDVLAPLIDARVQMCAGKGFDAVDFDNVDGYTNKTGFPLTAADQVAYDRRIAGIAHARGLSVGLKNDLEQASQLVSSFDFAINEQCYQFQECNLLAPFTAAGKAVLHIEYSLATGSFCTAAKRAGFSSIRKHLSLDAWRQSC